jgi:hypothetical protein
MLNTRRLPLEHRKKWVNGKTQLRLPKVFKPKTDSIKKICSGHESFCAKEMQKLNEQISLERTGFHYLADNAYNHPVIKNEENLNSRGYVAFSGIWVKDELFEPLKVLFPLLNDVKDPMASLDWYCEQLEKAIQEKEGQ